MVARSHSSRGANHARFTELAGQVVSDLGLAASSSAVAAAASTAAAAATSVAAALPASLLSSATDGSGEWKQHLPQQQEHVLQRDFAFPARHNGHGTDMGATIVLAASAALELMDVHVQNSTDPSGSSGGAASQTSSAMYVLGICLMIVGNFASAFGMLCLKRATTIPGMPFYRNGWWWGGIFLFAVTAAGLDVIVFAVTPLALIAPFAGLTIVVAFLLAYYACCGVKEVPTKTTLVAVCFIVLGVTLSSIWGPHDEGEMTPADLQEIYRDQPWLLWVSVLGGVCFGLFVWATGVWKEQTRPVRRHALPPMVVAPRGGRSSRHHARVRPRTPHHTLSTSAPILPSILMPPACSECAIRLTHPPHSPYLPYPLLLPLATLPSSPDALFAIPRVPRRPRLQMLRHWAGALSLAVLSAFYASLTQLQFKGLASAIFDSISALCGGPPADGIYDSIGELFAQLLAVASSMVAQVGFLNYAIGAAPVAYSVPAYQAGLLLFTLILSGFVLDEYDELDSMDRIMFWLGAAVVAFGMLLNAWGLTRKAEAERLESLQTPGEETLLGDLGRDDKKPKKRAPWEDDYPGADGDPEKAEAARKAAAAKFSD